MNSLSGEIDKNLDKIEGFVARAADLNVKIICFPELSVTGYLLKDPLEVCSRSLFLSVIKRLEEMAGKRDIVILAGLIEPAKGPRPFISHVAVSSGGLLGTYRKTHLSPKEKKIFMAGDRLGVLSDKGLTFGIQLCYETHFPEISTVMALKGAHILFAPHASPRGTPEKKRESWLRHLPARAFDNSLYFFACNQTGLSREGLMFPGVVIALDPMGRIMNQYAGNMENLITLEVDLKKLEDIRSHKMKHFLPHRRPELYR
jgi:N-carbamoylputrescine amidase